MLLIVQNGHLSTMLTYFSFPNIKTKIMPLNSTVQAFVVYKFPLTFKKQKFLALIPVLFGIQDSGFWFPVSGF